MKHSYVSLMVMTGLVFLGVGCRPGEEKWMGVYYPKSSLSSEIHSPYFDTLDECKTWIDGQWVVYGKKMNDESDDAGCGMNCAKEEGRGVYECHSEFVHYLHP